MKKPKQVIRSLVTRSGTITFPTYVPVTTFGGKYPLDNLVRPFLPRLASAVMVSYHYAKQAKEGVGVPMMVDSGGFASLFEWAEVEEMNGLGVIRIKSGEDEEIISPDSVLSFQEECADVAFTLDLPIPPARAETEGERRMALSITNAIWASRNKRRRDLPLFACIQGWDAESYTRCAKALIGHDFQGIAIGGLVPRMHDREALEAIVTNVRAVFPDLPLHVFGLGVPHLVKRLFELGVDSVDSSAYVKLAADGKRWGDKATQASVDLAPLNRMHLALANLATASQRALPLGFAQIMYGTIQSRVT